MLSVSVNTRPDLVVNNPVFQRSFRKTEVEWEDLLYIVLSHWSPVVFKNGHRLGANFESVDVMCLDIDGEFSLVEAYDLFEDYKCIIATTKSHQKPKGNAPPCDRYRVLAPFDRQITSAEHFKGVMQHWVSASKSDPTAMNPTPYFAPCLEVIHAQDGLPIPAEWEPKKDFQTKPKRIARTGVKKPKLTRNLDELHAGKCLLELPGSGRHSLLVACAKDLYRQQFSYEEIYEHLRRFSAPDKSDHEIKGIVDWTFETL